MDRLLDYKGGTIYKTLFVLFALSWFFLIGPSIFNSAGQTDAERALSKNNQFLIDVICAHGVEREKVLGSKFKLDAADSKAVRTVAVPRGLSTASLNRLIASACDMTPPVSLTNSATGAIQPLDKTLSAGKYRVEPVDVKTAGIRDEWRDFANKDPDAYAKVKEALKKKLKDEETRKGGFQGPTSKDDPRYKGLMPPDGGRFKVEYKIKPGKPGPHQMNPPPDTEDIIYPKPIRKPEFADGNITFLAGAINIGRKMHAGKRPEDYKFEEDYLQVMRLILSWKKPTMLIIQRKYYQYVEDVVHDQAVIHFVEIDDLRSWKYYPQIEKIRRSKDWQQIASWIPDSPQAYSDLYNPLIMRKIYWLQELCHLNPFDTKYFMWVDSGICSYGLTADKMDYLSRRYENMMAPGFLATNSPRDGGHEIQGFYRWKLEEMAGGKRVSYLTKGGTFGGTCPDIDKVLPLYDNALSESLRQGFLGTEESIFTIAYYAKPEIFHEFRQERPESIGHEHLCLMNDRNYHHPAFNDPDDHDHPHRN